MARLIYSFSGSVCTDSIAWMFNHMLGTAEQSLHNSVQDSNIG